MSDSVESFESQVPIGTDQVQADIESSQHMRVDIRIVPKAELEQGGEGLTTLHIEDQRARFEKMITDKGNSHVAFAALGNEVFPMVDHEGRPFDIKNPDYSQFLKEHSPEKKQVQDHIVGWFRSVTATEENPEGLKMEEIGRIAQLGERSSEYQALKKQIMRGILDGTGFLMGLKTDKEKREKLEEALTMADEWYRKFIANTYPKEKETEFWLTDEVEYEMDISQLIMMTFNQKEYTPRQRAEAKRKVLTALDMGHLAQKKGKRRGLNRYAKEMKKAGVFYTDPETGQTGEIYKRWLVSYHKIENGRKCDYAYFTDEKPTNVDENTKVMLVPMRKALVNERDENDKPVFDEAGKPKKKIIYVGLASRPKETEGEFEKGMMKDSKNPNRVGEDRNGERYIHENMSDLFSFRRHQKDCFHGRGNQIREWDQEISNEGRSVKNGTKRPGQNGDLQIIKFNEEVTFPPEYDEEGNEIEPLESHVYEHQLFTGEMYANYHHQRGVMHRQYKTNRVHDSSMTQLVNPRPIYGHDPLELQLEKNMEINAENWSEKDRELCGIEFREKYQMALEEGEKVS